MDLGISTNPTPETYTIKVCLLYTSDAADD